MEHSAVVDRVIESITENLTYTYIELGRSTPNAHAWVEEGFTACCGSMEHPICNFAACNNIGPSASRLRELGGRRNCFRVYLMPPARDRDRHALAAEGFDHSHDLTLMVSDDVHPDRVDLESADDRSGRLRIAEFMTEQFFHRQPTGFRRGIAEATATAQTLKLYRAPWKQRTAAAVMISEHSGIFGLYNLCVAPHFRGRGWGSAIVRTIVGEAKTRGQSVTLQCEPSLSSWYSSLGFREVGAVSVFGLYRFKEIDIMG